jgi:TRAP-type C4-dicarboxylate transport system permease large subunit
MDATQKRRIWKVAIAHFVLTLFILIKFLRHAIPSADRDIWLQTWGGFWSIILRLLQPQILILGKIGNLFNSSDSLIIPISIFASIPIWSLCFGWIFAKLDNWLNHFPILGRRVF